MTDKLTLMVTPRHEPSEHYDWVDIDVSGTRVGKSRCRIVGGTVTVYSIVIYPEFQGRGYGTRAIELLRAGHPTMVADRVRFTARHFWQKMGFVERPDGNWQYPGPGSLGDC